MAERTNLRKRHTILPLFGAGIVLLAFISKEVKRDHFKEIEDALRAAQTTYQIRRDTHEILTRINMDKVVTMALTGHDTDRSRMEFNVTSSQYRLLALESLLDESKVLVDALPDNEELEKHVADLSANRKNLDVLADSLTTILSSSESPSVDLKTQSFYRTLDEGQDKLDNQIASLSEDTVKRTQREKSLSKKNYDRWTNVSYIAFAVGWLLALVGKLRGEDVGIGD